MVCQSLSELWLTPVWKEWALSLQSSASLDAMAARPVPVLAFSAVVLKMRQWQHILVQAVGRAEALEMLPGAGGMSRAVRGQKPVSCFVPRPTLLVSI